MFEVIPLTAAEKEARIKSGPTKIESRTGWAMSHLTKAGFIEKVARATYRATDKGHRFLASHSGPITQKVLAEKAEGYTEAWKSASERNQEARQAQPVGTTTSSTGTPEETIDQAIDEVESNLQAELMQQLAVVDPYRFEQIVIDLLFAMGYGGSREEAASVTRKSNDEGIDGIINEDRLGLDVIYVQAKRWQGNIGRKEIQSFVGALAGKQANKGVFITTSDFAQNAWDYAQSVSQKVILINGPRLANLMIEHNIGVSIVRTIALKRLDSDYFGE
ncbi:MAG: restriction endonuclease [Wenzhouxiangellaceae bacterium]